MKYDIQSFYEYASLFEVHCGEEKENNLNFIKAK